MKNIKTNLYIGNLYPTSISTMSDEIDQYLQAEGLELKERLKIRLGAEDILDIWSRELGETAKCQLVSLQRFGRHSLRLIADGKSVDPSQYQDELLLSMSDNINMVTALGLPAQYRYIGGQNEVIFQLPAKKKISTMMLVLIAIVMALVCGLVVRHMLPSFADTFIEQFVSPLTGAITRLLRLASGPLVFLSILSGITSIGNASSAGKIGGMIVRRSFIVLIIFGMVTWLSISWIYPAASGSSAGGGDIFGKLFSIILDIIPDNIIDPFQTGNAMQIIFLAGCVGIVSIILGDTVIDLLNIVNQLSAIVQLIMSIISKTLPVFIFLCVTNLVVTSDLSQLSQILIPLLLVYIVSTITMLLYALYASIRTGMPYGKLLRTQMQSFLTGFFTASSAAAFSTNVDCCVKELKIDEKLVRFGVPFGQVLFMPSAVILFVITAVAMANQYGVTMSPSWIITLVFVSTILAMAAPPIPGGALSTTIILFSQLGIPAESMAIAAAILTFADYISTATNIVCLQHDQLIIGKKLNMLNTNMLNTKEETK